MTTEVLEGVSAMALGRRRGRVSLNEGGTFSVANGGYADNGIHNDIRFADNRDHRLPSGFIEDPQRKSQT